MPPLVMLLWPAAGNRAGRGRSAAHPSHSSQSKRSMPWPYSRPNSMTPPTFLHRARKTRRSEEHTSELQSHVNLVCRLMLEKKKFRRVIRTNHKKASKIWRHENIQLGGCQS